MAEPWKFYESYESTKAALDAHHTTVITHYLRVSGKTFESPNLVFVNLKINFDDFVDHIRDLRT